MATTKKSGSKPRPRAVAAPSGGYKPTAHPEVLQRLDTLETRLESIEKSLTKYKGMVGGMMLVISTLGALCTVLWDYFKTKFLG